MDTYRYQALNSQGVAVAGEIEANDRREAASRLRASGVFPTAVEGPVGARASPDGRGVRRPRLSRAQVAVLTRELADLVSSGMPLHRCLSILCEQTAGRQRQLLQAVSEEVQRGAPLSEVLRPLSRSFSTLYVEMIRAGESSGHLDAVLTRLAEYLEVQEVRRSQLLSALAYPTVIVLVAVGAIVFMVTFLVPRLSVVFADVGQALPAPTRLLLAIAHGVPLIGPWIAGVLVLLYLGARRAAATQTGGKLLDGALLRLPLAGRLVTNATIARFARTLATLLAGGVPMLSALEIAAATSANRVIGAQAESIQQRAREGESLSHAMTQCRAFPPALVHMAAVGEETGNLPSMLARYADAADFQFDQSMRRLTSLVEPAIILVMGGIVAFIVLSVLLPVFQIYSAVDVSRGAP
jgi:type II secretion system protein F